MPLQRFKREILGAGGWVGAGAPGGVLRPRAVTCSGSNTKLLQDGAHIEVVTLLPDPVAGHLDHEA